jgi:membrane-bound lytic murein transglycosylase D
MEEPLLMAPMRRTFGQTVGSSGAATRCSPLPLLLLSLALAAVLPLAAAASESPTTPKPAEVGPTVAAPAEGMVKPTEPAATVPASGEANDAGRPAVPPALPASGPAAPAADTAVDLAPPAPPVPRSRLDPEQDAARSNLWDRIRNDWQMPNLEGERVGKWEQHYARQPDYVQRMVTRGARYLFHIVEEVQRRELPSELALLPFIESAFNPQAQSSARASGMWQFMPATGKEYELRQNVFRDDRRDVLASTRAALDYLQKLHRLFGDWHLALAAYNWGQGNVLRAIAANRRAGKATDYASLDMPNETRDYVPKLQAVKNLVAAPDRLGLALPMLENHPYFLSVPIERDIDVAVAARLAGLSQEEFQALNPQMNKPVILAAGVPQVLLPYDNANRFLRELSSARGPLATWTAWVAPRKIKLGEAAKLVGMAEGELRDVNRIPAGMLLNTGSTLLVPRPAHSTADVAEHVADNAMLALSPEQRPLRKLSFKASKKGDSVAAVARRYRVSAAQLGQWNGVPPDGRFKPGQAVIVMQAAPAARPAARQAAQQAARQPATGAVPTQRQATALAKPKVKAVRASAPKSKPATRTRVAQAAPR